MSQIRNRSLAWSFAFGLLVVSNLAVAQQSESSSTQDAVQEQDSASSAAAQEVSTQERRNQMDHFMRIKRDRKGRPLAMQTSVTRYEMTTEAGESVSVDLIGVVHVGEKEYYEQLNAAFEQYDGLLYELVAPEGTVIPKGGRGGGVGANPLGMLQKGMQEGLGLEFQLEHIDYTKSNFVHADMTPEEFGQSMSDNDESVAKMVFKAMGQSMAMQSSGKGGSEMKMLMAMFSNNREMRLRRIAAEQMRDMEAGMIMFDGKDGSTIIDHRNAKAMEVLKREMVSGKKKVALFYGAGHLPDMERRLMSDFQMKRAGQYWLDAWKLR